MSGIAAGAEWRRAGCGGWDGVGLTHPLALVVKGNVLHGVGVPLECSLVVARLVVLQ